MSELNNLLKLSGLAPIAEAEAAPVPTEQPEVVRGTNGPECVECPVPAEIKSALKKIADKAMTAHKKAVEEKEPNEARQRMIAHDFFNQLNSTLDGTEMGFKKAGQLLHSAVNFIVNEIPDEVIKYLSGNASEELNKEEVHKDALEPRKKLKDYMNQFRKG